MPYEYEVSGYSHKYNAQKTNILVGVFYYFPNWCDVYQIAECVGQPEAKIAPILSYWFRHHYKYVSRRKVKEYKGLKYEYKLRKQGLEALLNYVNRIRKHYELNRNKRVPVKVDKYLTLKNNEHNISITEEDLPDFTKIVDKFLEFQNSK